MKRLLAILLWLWRDAGYAAPEHATAAAMFTHDGPREGRQC